MAINTSIIYNIIFFSMSQPNTNVKERFVDDNFVPSMLIKDAATNELSQLQMVVALPAPSPTGTASVPLC